ncbi:MAG TPA: thiol:disulfide interchange protein DsbA/DsbL [Steroidobacteraceae bacterium]|jgi:thiol:disulfide interchange protein DsbA|nr:thiol:disulfide interchange protein DsbA/DsbL [Steroidobacteraceae bacterium]
MIRPLILTPLLSLVVCACGHASTSHQHNATQVAQQAPPAATPAQSAAATVQSETEEAAAAQETAGDNAGEDRTPPDRGDVSLEHLAALPADAVLPGGKWKPGTNYDVLTPAQPTNVSPGKIEVVEVFWLGCPHCYALEPFVQAWLKNKPAYIEFVRVPVMWGPAHRAHARLFYTLQALNRPDLFEKAFDTIQQKHEPLIAQSEDETLKLQEAFAKDNGIAPGDFAKAYNSFTVNSNLQRAEQLTQRYQVQGVPLVVVDGKYSTDVAKAGGPQQLIQIIDDLAASAHHH